MDEERYKQRIQRTIAVMRRLRQPADRVYTKLQPSDESIKEMEMMLYEKNFWKRVAEAVRELEPSTSARIAIGLAKSARVYFGKDAADS